MNEWRPHPKQEQALLSTAFETLYGGARGGGKTDAGVVFLLYDHDSPDYRALVIRKNHEDLKDWIDRARNLYAATGAKFVGNPVEIHFPNGGKIFTGHFKDDNSYTKYQGQEYCRMLIEELTQIPSEELYMKLVSSCRSTKGLRPMIFATANPGGAGHAWVKKRFIDPSVPGKVFIDPISGRTRVFIPATVEDNPTIMAKDPDYVKFLDSLPEDLREQWRKGNWNMNVIKGAYFQTDLEQATRENRITKIPFNPYQSVFVAFDLGISQGNDMVLTFFQIDGKEIKVLRCYGETNQAYGFYIQYLREQELKYSYRYGKIFLPHDGTRRSMDTMVSFKQMLDKAGFITEVIPRTISKQADIELTRTLFPRLSFDAESCSTLLEALALYRRDWSEERGVYQDKPFHDWSSNYADSLMVLARAVQNQPSPAKMVKKSYGFTVKQGYSKKLF